MFCLVCVLVFAPECEIEFCLACDPNDVTTCFSCAGGYKLNHKDVGIDTCPLAAASAAPVAAPLSSVLVLALLMMAVLF